MRIEEVGRVVQVDACRPSVSPMPTATPSPKFFDRPGDGERLVDGRGVVRGRAAVTLVTCRSGSTAGGVPMMSIARALKLLLSSVVGSSGLTLIASESSNTAS